VWVGRVVLVWVEQGGGAHLEKKFVFFKNFGGRGFGLIEVPARPLSQSRRVAVAIYCSLFFVLCSLFY
jgi:hypothetical protein